MGKRASIFFLHGPFSPLSRVVNGWHRKEKEFVRSGHMGTIDICVQSFQFYVVAVLLRRNRLKSLGYVYHFLLPNKA